MKVSIITLHRVFNYGSVLQTYATERLFKNLGCETEVIDYIPPKWQNKALYWDISQKRGLLKDGIYRILRAGSVILKKKTFGGFLNKNINLTKPYKSFEVLCNDCPEADIYCTGSDQVWNSHYSGIDKAFYLRFVRDDAKRIAIAASIGKTELSEEEAKTVKEYLSDYSLVTVRESSAVSLLERIGIKSEVILDPTLQIEREHWISLASKRLIKDRYLILMLLYNEDNNATEYARKISDEKGLKLVKLSWELKKPPLVDVLMTHRRPEDFLSLFYYADYVVTNSFHGLAFSINLNKQFTVVKRNEFNSRIDSLLEITGLTERMINHNLDMNIVDKPIDYNKVNDILNNERIRTQIMMRENIDGK